MHCRYRSSALLLGLAFVLPSCVQADASGPGASPVATAAQSQPAMTRALKKANGSGIDVQYAVVGAPQVARMTAVTLRLDGVTDPAGGHVRFSADPGLTLSRADAVPLPTGVVTTVTIQATPASEGIVYLHVFTTQRGVTTATSVPIQVGQTGPAMRSAGEMQKAPTGDAVISMPVR